MPFTFTIPFAVSLVNCTEDRSAFAWRARPYPYNSRSNAPTAQYSVCHPRWQKYCHSCRRVWICAIFVQLRPITAYSSFPFVVFVVFFKLFIMQFPVPLSPVYLYLGSLHTHVFCCNRTMGSKNPISRSHKFWTICLCSFRYRHFFFNILVFTSMRRSHVSLGSRITIPAPPFGFTMRPAGSPFPTVTESIKIPNAY